jgi:hypothetical protein
MSYHLTHISTGTEVHVTIAAGFICNEGVVIAADSQETIVGYTKESKAKVHTITFPPTVERQGLLTYVYAGAGDTDYIETAMEGVDQALGPSRNFVEAVSAIDGSLIEFQAKRMAPWAAFRQEQRPFVELLIGLSVGSAFGLLHYSGTAFHRCQGHKAIGTGALLANSLMSTYCLSGDGVDKLVRLACYILHKVKKYVDGCGGYTQIAALRKDGDFTFAAKIEEFEADIVRLERKSVEDFRAQIFSSSALPTLTWLADGTRKLKTGES